jgi:hypothetical protein
VLDQLIGVFEAAGPDRPVDIDNAAQRESLDVIGRVGRSLGTWVHPSSLPAPHAAPRWHVDNRTRCLAFVGFDTDFQAVTSMTSKSGANRALDALHGGRAGCHARLTCMALQRQHPHIRMLLLSVYRRTREHGTRHRSFAVLETL